MSIPEAQLETWSHQGSIRTSKITADRIKDVLKSDVVLQNRDFELYLQGSYKNDTNIRGDSDVDVVVQLNDTFGMDLTRLDEEDKRLFHQAYPPPTYQWREFREDVLNALRESYGNENIIEGNKSIKIQQISGYLPADVIVCLHYRKYLYFETVSNQSYIDGIKFYTLNEEKVINNYPKEHYRNGVEKNSASHTNSWFKPMVRVFKNARTYLVDKDILTKEQTPSYFIECLIYNAPDRTFGDSYQNSYRNILTWLNQAALPSFNCINKQQKLFGDTPEQWDIPAAQLMIATWIKLWNEWV